MLGALYLSLAFAAGTSDSDDVKATDLTVMGLSQPAGTIAVAVAGLVIIGVGVFSGNQEATQKFVESLERGHGIRDGGHRDPD